MTREEWLEKAQQTLKDTYFSGKPYPEVVRVSCGFPLGKRKAIGQAWHHKCSETGEPNIFICPSIADNIRVLDILLHEMIHQSVGIEHGHKKPFVDEVKRVGLAGKATATYAEAGSTLYEELSVISDTLGKYPHGAMSKTIDSKQSARSGLLTFVSVNNPEYKVRITAKIFDDYGAPLDYTGETMEQKQ